MGKDLLDWIFHGGCWDIVRLLFGVVGLAIAFVLLVWAINPEIREEALELMERVYTNRQQPIKGNTQWTIDKDGDLVEIKEG